MSIFKKWFGNDNNSQISQKNIDQDSSAIQKFVFNDIFVDKKTTLFKFYPDMSEYKVMLMIEKLQALKTPIANLDEDFGQQVMDLVVSSRFNDPSVALLAFVLDKGYQLNEKMLFRLEGYNKVSYKCTLDAFEVAIKQQDHTSLENQKNVIKVLDLLTSFGANWNTPSRTDLQYPTVLDYLYHNFKNEGHATLTEYLKDYYQDRAPQKMTLLNTDDILRRRMEKLFASDENDIQIETGEKVTISATPKSKRINS